MIIFSPKENKTIHTPTHSEIVTQAYFYTESKANCTKCSSILNKKWNKDSIPYLSINISDYF